MITFSELDKDDSDRQHRMIVNNGVGNATYEFRIPNIEGKIHRYGDKLVDRGRKSDEMKEKVERDRQRDI